MGTAKSKDSSTLKSPLLEYDHDSTSTGENTPPHNQQQQEQPAKHIPPNPPTLKITRSTKLYAFCAALNSCNLGYDIGVNTGAGMLLQNSLSLSDVQLEVFMGSINLFAMVGALCSHWISDKFGRRWSFRVAALIFILGTIIQCVSNTYTTLMFGRAFVGLGVGFGLAVDPVYISEISMASHRGRLVTWSEFGINLGIVFGFCSGLIFATVDANIAWRLMFALGVIMPCLVIVLSIWVLPESPRWLVANNRGDEACDVLQKIYPDGYDVTSVVEEIKDGIEIESLAEHAVGWGIIFFPSPAFKRMIMVGVGTAIAQQAVGTDAIIYFMVYILNAAGIHSRTTQMWILVGVGLIKLGVIFIAGRLLDRKGRRPLFFISLLGCAVSFFIVAMAFIGASRHASETAAIVGLALYLAFFSIGMGPGAWLIPSEVFTTTIRAKAMSLATFSNRAVATIFASSFLSVANAMSWSGFFIMMTVVCLIVLAWICIYVPETKGKSLEEMSKLFAEITGDTSVLEAEETLYRRGPSPTSTVASPEQEILL